MSSTVSLICRNEISGIKTFSDAVAPGPTFSSKSSEDPYTAATTIPVTKESKFTVTLTAGAYTLDFTVCPSDTDGVFDASGLKLQKLRLEMPGTNANKMSVANGASNGYRTDGATTASLSVTLAPTQKSLFEFDEAADDVGGTRKTLDFAGTASQTCKVHVAFG